MVNNDSPVLDTGKTGVLMDSWLAFVRMPGALAPLTPINISHNREMAL